jgi:hypothetical protein
MANCLSIRTALVAAVNLGWLWTCAQSPPAYVQRRAVNAESSMLGTLPTVWSGDALLTADFNGSDLPVIQRLDRGRVLEKIPFAIPGSKSVRIEALAGWSDGRLAVIGSALHAKGKPWNFLTLIAADRQSAVAKDLENFFPKLIVVSPDGTVWVMGASREPQGTWYNNILRHYDKEGKPLDGRYFYYQPTVDHVTGSVLRCSRDRLGWLTNTNEYMEITFQGEVTPAIAGPSHDGVGWEVGMSMSANNEVIITATRPSGWGVWRFDRSKSRWQPVELRSSETIDSPMTVGFDDDSLVAFLFWPGRRVGWFDTKK